LSNKTKCTLYYYNK